VTRLVKRVDERVGYTTVLRTAAVLVKEIRPARCINAWGSRSPASAVRPAISNP
jgi:hypothetical protein